VSKSAGMRASISDAFSGMRWFSSDGWSGSALSWERRNDSGPVERFTYRFDDKGELQVDWSIARANGKLTLGDTLSCLKG
jgi:hypothetical protein